MLVGAVWHVGFHAMPPHLTEGGWGGGVWDSDSTGSCHFGATRGLPTVSLALCLENRPGPERDPLFQR